MWPLLNDFARIPVCGLIAQHNAAMPMPGPDMFPVLRKRLTLRGCIVWDLGYVGKHLSVYPLVFPEDNGHLTETEAF